MTKLTAIGFDADDTLWECEHFYRSTESYFTDFLTDYAAKDEISARLLEIERKNIKLYGFGIKGFTLSMIEAALDVTNDRVDPAVIRRIIAMAHDMFDHPVQPLPHVRETLEAAANDHRLILITKGDLFDQERKLAASGLGEYFSAVEIVSHKTRATYEKAFAEYADGPGQSMMVGNSLKSDVIPALEAGSWGVHVPHSLTWAIEHADEPQGQDRYHKIDTLAGLMDIVAAVKG